MSFLWLCLLAQFLFRQREAGREREREGGGQHSELVGGKIRKERSWKIDRNEEGRKICSLIAPSLVAGGENLSQWDKNVWFSCQHSRVTARLPPIIQPLSSVFKKKKKKHAGHTCCNAAVFNLRMSPARGGRGVNKSLMNHFQVVDDGGRVESQGEKVNDGKLSTKG